MRCLFVISIFILLGCSPRVIRCSGYDEVDKNIECIFQVEGALTTSSSYCGGADIGDEIYEYQKQRPFRTTIYIRQGTENNEKSKIIDSVSTDAE